jgi:hypothetical protein
MNSRAATGWNGDNANRAKNPALAMVGRRAAFEALADFG